jgi:hypothetical protein
MKSTGSFYPTLIVALLMLGGCGSKPQDSQDDEHGHGHHEEGEWKEMDEFHVIMRETFHPYKDSANLEPAKRRASELMTGADQWASAELPDKVDNAEVKTKLEQLKSEATTLAESVKSADDNVIGEHLTQLHDTFHELQEAWYGGH